MLLSIIVTCYNKEKVIKSTLDSVANQNYSDWECIIVEDCSTDNSLEAIKEFLSEHDTRFKLIQNKENRGVANSRNIGLDNASGKYIFPLDGDDLLKPDFCREGISFLEENSDYSMFYGTSMRIQDGKKCIEQHSYSSYLDILRHSNFLVSSILRKDMIERGWDPQFDSDEDWEFYIRYLYHNDKIKFSNVPSIEYRADYGSRQRTTKEETIKKIKSIHKEKFREFGKLLRIGFLGFWEGGDINLFKYRTFYRALMDIQYEEVNPYEEEADLVFISVFDRVYKNKIKGNPVLISYRGEPENTFGNPEALTKFHIGFKPNDEFNLYFPIWRTYYLDYKENLQENPDKTDFCAFIVSAPWGKERNEMFKYIDENYKHVDSIGNYMNNTGFVLPKRDFKYPSKYKFILCYENSPSDEDYMYITEKIIWAFTYGCIPIYWGNKQIGKYFNENAFINANGLSKEEILEKIKEVDNNDELYNQMRKEPILTKEGSKFVKRTYIRYMDFIERAFKYYGKEFNFW